MNKRDWPRVGNLMSASHVSLRDDYQVSCSELDLMVDLTRRLGGTDVYGSRMTGGGFGGCTISLVKRSSSEDLAQSITAAYAKETSITPEIFVVLPSDGCRPLTTNSLKETS